MQEYTKEQIDNVLLSDEELVETNYELWRQTGGCSRFSDETLKDCEWFPVARGEDNFAIPYEANYKIPYWVNPSPYKQKKERRAGLDRLESLRQKTNEYRYLLFLWVSDSMESTKQFMRMVRLYKQIDMRITPPYPTKWPCAWEKHFMEALKNGLDIHTAAKLLRISTKDIDTLLKALPAFADDVDMVLTNRQQDLVKNLLDIALRGETESNRLKATSFALERMYKKDYGPSQEMVFDKPTSPMEKFLNMNKGTDSDSGEE